MTSPSATLAQQEKALRVHPAASDDVVLMFRRNKQLGIIVLGRAPTSNMFRENVEMDTNHLRDGRLGVGITLLQPHPKCRSGIPEGSKMLTGLLIGVLACRAALIASRVRKQGQWPGSPVLFRSRYSSRALRSSISRVELSNSPYREARAEQHGAAKQGFTRVFNQPEP